MSEIPIPGLILVTIDHIMMLLALYICIHISIGMHDDEDIGDDGYPISSFFHKWREKITVGTWRNTTYMIPSSSAYISQS